MRQRKAKQLEKASQVGRNPTTRTHVLGGLAAAAVVTVFSAEIARIWRLGMLPQSRSEEQLEEPPGRVRHAALVLREGYTVSRTRENSLFNMLASFSATFAITRAITVYIREYGGIGPMQNVVVGSRHIHHFVPGGLIALTAGGVAIGLKGDRADKYLAFPFGIGVALVLDESAMLLELEDVYWTEEGVLSVQIVFAAMALLSGLAYLFRVLRQPTGGDSEADWELAAKAWDDLQMIPGSAGVPGIGL